MAKIRYIVAIVVDEELFFDGKGLSRESEVDTALEYGLENRNGVFVESIEEVLSVTIDGQNYPTDGVDS